MHDVYRDLMRYADHLSIQHWLVILLVAVVLGFFCLRGFGSRSNY